MTLIQFVNKLFGEGAVEVRIDFCKGEPWQLRWRVRNLSRSVLIESGSVLRPGILEIP
jgi:hypothetical protein